MNLQTLLHGIGLMAVAPAKRGNTVYMCFDVWLMELHVGLIHTDPIFHNNSVSEKGILGILEVELLLGWVNLPSAILIFYRYQ